MSSIVCEQSLFELTKNLGLRCAIAYKVADLKYMIDMGKIERSDSILRSKMQNATTKTEYGKETNTSTEEEILDDGRETNVMVIKRDDGTEVIKPKDDIDFYQIDDDKLIENIEEACKVIRGTGKLIDLTITSILYMGCIITPEQLYKRCKDNDDIEIVNTIVKYYSGIPVTTAVNSLNINEVISLNLLNKIVKFECSYYNANLNTTEIPNVVIDEILEKTRDLMIEASRNNLKMDGVSDPDPVIPIMFVNKNLDLTQPQRLSKGVVAKLEKEIGDILCMYKYQFNRINDLIELMIYNNGRMDQYIIDPGTIIGNGFNVICNAPGNDTVMVNISHKDILAKVFADVAYVLTPEEMMEVNKDMFLNQGVYGMIDMSKGPEILPKLSQEEFIKLGKKLSFIINLPWNPVIIPAGRLRIRSFKSVDDFVLVSDDKCKSPLPYHNLTNITPGLSVRVNGDDVEVKCNDIEQKYHIDEYGVL